MSGDFGQRSLYGDRRPGRADQGRAGASRGRGAGGTILTNCAVRGVETFAGRISGVVTEHGPIRCSNVVLAGGAWSRLFAGNLGIDFPQLKILGTVARVGPVEGVPDMPVGGGNFAFRKRLDGGYSIAMRNANVVPIVPDSFRLFCRLRAHADQAVARTEAAYRQPLPRGMADAAAVEAR
jgi:glycine/D-amino acid oxidase-like deaminating enzyme